MIKARARPAPEVIGLHLSSDVADIKDMRYQPTRFPHPAVYAIGSYYFCCPSGSKLPVDRDIPDRWNWEVVGEYNGRKVYRAHMGSDR